MTFLSNGGIRHASKEWWTIFEDGFSSFKLGRARHYHPELKGVIDLRGRTNMRQLVRLVYHAQGVLCPVTAVMHLAAAVEVKNKPGAKRPCVVVAGGREPAHWEAYPNHQFIHTNGALPCCAQGGCWKSRVTPLQDGDQRDQSLCSNVIDNKLPKCMDMITAEDVIQRIEWYFQGGSLNVLTESGPCCKTWCAKNPGA